MNLPLKFQFQPFPVLLTERLMLRRLEESDWENILLFRSDPANERSEMLLVKNGYRKEAHFHENYYYNGAWLDSIVYTKLAPK